MQEDPGVTERNKEVCRGREVMGLNMFDEYLKASSRYEELYRLYVELKKKKNKSAADEKNLRSLEKDVKKSYGKMDNLRNYFFGNIEL